MRVHKTLSLLSLQCFFLFFHCSSVCLKLSVLSQNVLLFLVDASAVLGNKRKRAQNSEHFLYENQQETSTAPASEYRIFSQMDDIDIFFYGLAQTMKKLRPLTVAKLKKEIANSVNDAEIRELEQVECVKDEGFTRS